MSQRWTTRRDNELTETRRRVKPGIHRKPELSYSSKQNWTRSSKRNNLFKIRLNYWRFCFIFIFFLFFFLFFFWEVYWMTRKRNFRNIAIGRNGRERNDDRSLFTSLLCGTVINIRTTRCRWIEEFIDQVLVNFQDVEMRYDIVVSYGSEKRWKYVKGLKLIKVQYE